MDAPAPAVASDGEIPSLRTATSRTYQAAHGGNRTEISAAPVNYRDSSGSWQKIDTTLKAATGGGWSPAATAVPTTVPASLASGAVIVGSGVTAVGFTLTGAAGTTSTSGPTATYGKAFPGVTVTETATSGGVRETFVLASAAARSAFAEQVSLPTGAAMTADAAGGATITGVTGTVLGTIAAPVVTDAAGATSTSAASLVLGTGNSLTVAVDPAWLTAPGRAFPVTLDPDYQSGGYASTSMIESGADATTNYSANTNDCVGMDPATGLTRRALISFADIGTAIPRDAYIGTASLGFPITTASGSSSFQVDELTRSFTRTTATWNQAATSTNWTNPGSDFTYTGQITVGAGTVNTGGTYTSTGLAPSVLQGWIDSNQYSQAGFVVQQPTESSSAYSCFAAGTGSSSSGPTLEIYWNHRVGIDSAQKYFTHSIDGHEKVSINLADGNLVDESGEFADNAPGVPLTINRTYNSFQATAPWMNGLGWWTTPSDSGVYYGGPSYSPFGNVTGSGYYATALSGDDDQKIYYTGLNGTFYNAPGDETMTRTGNTTTVTNNGSQAQENVTDSTNGQLASIVSRTGLTENVNHSSTYFGAGQDPDVTTVVDTVGRTYTYSYAGGGGYITGITGPTVNGAALTTGYTYQGGSTYQGSFQTPTLPNGELLTATDTNGGTTHYGYDSGSRINKITSPKGNIVTLTYAPGGQVGSITYITNVSAMTGDTYTFVYNQPNTTGGTGTTVVEDPLYTSGTAHTTTYTWNPDDQVTNVTDALGRNQATTYNANGNVATLADNLSDVTTLGYDNNNNLTTLTGANYGSGMGQTGAVTTVGYTTGSQTSPVAGSSIAGSTYLPNSQKDPQGNTTTYSYNANGQLSSVTPPSGIGGTALADHYQGDSGYSCGGRTGELCAAVDGNGHTTTYAYDSSGNPTTVTPPAPLGATTYTYDALGRVLTATDGKAQKTTYAYDGLGDILTLEFGGTSTCTTSDISAGNCIRYTYDQDGRLLTRASITGTVTAGYDLTGAALSKTVPGGTTTAVTYDNAGNVSTYIDAGGTVTYSYDGANELTGLAEPGGSCTGTITKCTTFGYNTNAQRNLTTYPSGETVALGYDGEGCETTITAKRPPAGTGTTFFSRTLTYQTTAPKDTALVQSLSDVNSGTTTTTSYAGDYDAYNRLTGATVGSNTYGYTYDPAGNRLTATKTATTSQAYGYNNADQLCYSGATSGSQYGTSCPSTPSGDTAYTYDADGNQATGGLSFGYNTKNQTTTAGTLTATYADSGQTERATTSVSGTATTLLNGIEGLSGQTIGTGTPAYFTRDPNGNLIGMRIGAGSGSTNSYYLTDQQGSVLRLTDTTGNTDTASYTYDPYGQTLTATGTQATTNPYRYGTGYYDSATSLLKLGTRYDNPALGRWTQHDTVSFGIANSGNLNSYAYVGDDPASLIDPAGRFGIGAIFASIAVVAAVAAVVVIAAPETLVAGAVYVVAVDTGLAGGAYDIGCGVHDSC